MPIVGTCEVPMPPMILAISFVFRRFVPRNYCGPIGYVAGRLNTFSHSTWDTKIRVAGLFRKYG